MRKTKYLIGLFILISVSIILLLVSTSNVKAAQTFTTTDGIVAKKVVESTDGTVEFKLTNINLSAEKQYTWGIATSSVATSVEKWYTLADVNETNKTASISVTPTETKLRDILKTTDTAWIFVKDAEDNYIINGLKVDLSLAPEKAFVITKDQYFNPSVLNNPAWDITKLYNISNYSYVIQKITDATLISQYATANGDLSKVQNLATLDDAPTTGWTSCSTSGLKIVIKNSAIPKEDGLYYIWIKAKDTDSKTIIGYNVVSLDDEAPTVKSISVTSPASGTYKTSQTVKIRVLFSEIITGTTVPTLKIKFGESAERTVTNGTINGTYIEYSYNIQETDKGQLATISYTGGTIKDAAGNDAKLSCPIISGNTIKANVEGITNNNTQNTNNANNSGGNQVNSNNATGNNVVDNTTASGKLPQTGVETAITLVILILLVGSIAFYYKYRKLKDI